MPQKLFIFDDMISDDMMNDRRSSFLKKFATSGRHRNISIVLLIQHLGSVPLSIRNQMTNILIGMTPDSENLRKWLTKYKHRMTTDEIMSMYDQARQTNKGYGFFHLMTEKDGYERYGQNLDV